MKSTNYCHTSSSANPRKLISLEYSCKLHWCRKPRAVFSQPEIGDQIWIQCRQYRQSTSKSIVKLNYKIQYPRNSGSKKESMSYFLRFFFKNSSSKYQKRFAIGGYTTMFFAANCLVWQPRNRQIHRVSLASSETLVLLDSWETLSRNGVGSTENDCVVKCS